MKFDEIKLREKWSKMSTLDLNHPIAVNKDDHITIFHHPGGRNISFTNCTCRIAGKCDQINKDVLNRV